MCNDYAKTNEHIKSEMSKTHGLAIANPSQFWKGSKDEDNDNKK